MPEPPIQSLANLAGVSVIELLRRGSWSSVPADTIASFVGRGRLVEFSAGLTVYTEADAERLAVLCWYVYRGGPGLLALITIGNLANLSIFSANISGPEQYLAGRPLLLVTFIFVQIVVSLVLVGIFARRSRQTPAETRPAARQLAAEPR